MQPDEVRARIEALLNDATLDISELGVALVTLAGSESSAVRRLSSMWAERLYARDPEYFETFITGHLDYDDLPLLERLRALAETRNDESLFRLCYGQRLTTERLNADLLALVSSNQPDEAILPAVVRRLNFASHNNPVEDSVATALYKRNPKAFSRHILRAASERSGPGAYPQLRRAVGRHDRNSPLHLALFQRYATPEEWHARVEEILRTERGSVTDVTRKLDDWEPRYANRPELPDNLVNRLLKRFRERVQPWLEQKVISVAQRTVTEMLYGLEPENRNATGIETVLRNLQSRLGWRNYRNLAPTWMPFVYDHAPDVLVNYATHFAQNGHATVRALLARARQDGHYAVYRALYIQVATLDEWNAELLALAKSGLTGPTLERELERFDFTYTHGKYTNLTDEAATALYRAERRAWPFIEQHLPHRGGKYPRLLEALSAAEGVTSDTFQRMFRRFGSGEHWEKIMESLLQQDIPPSEILNELNRWHPVSFGDASPAILKRLLEKYGETVLPYLERTLNWATEPRLRSLLALDISNSSMLRQMSAIAYRQPAEFTRMAHVWALPLYERGGDAFATLFTRYLGRPQEYIVRQMLKLAEQNGQKKLFNDLYQRIANNRVWEADVRRLIAATADDEALLKGLELRFIRWGRLPGDLALTLYRRNADLFRDYLIRQTASGARKEYDDLVKEAERRHDEGLLQAVNTTGSGKNWRAEVQKVLRANLPGDQVTAALKAIHPKRTWEAWRGKDVDILIDVVERYGADAMPYLLEYAGNVTDTEKLLKTVRRIGDHALYWQTFFRVTSWRDQDNRLKTWNESIRQAANRPADEFFVELSYMTPPPRESRWALEPETAHLLYERFGIRVLPFLESFLRPEQVEEPLLALAESRADQGFLDYLTFTQVLRVGALVGRISPRWGQGDATAKTQAEAMTPAIIARLERMYSASPDEYVRHVSNVLGRSRAFQFSRWNRDQMITKNPVFQHMAKQHPEAWLRAPNGIRDLLETPNIFIQLVALDFLKAGGVEAAQHVLKNLRVLRAMLLGGMLRRTKREVLAILVMAGRQGPEYAAPIVAALDDVVDFQSRRAIQEEALTAYVQLKGLVAQAETA